MTIIKPYDENKKLTVINFFSGPGTGKSVAAARLFALMKVHGYKVELIHEFAKDLVWEQRHDMFGEQDYIFAHQHRLIRRLVNHDVDYAIVDSSILLALFYRPDWFPPSFDQFVVDVFNTYNNINIFLVRNPDIPYQQWGRNESEQQAIEIDRRVREYMITNNVPYFNVVSGTGVEDLILNQIKKIVVNS